MKRFLLRKDGSVATEFAIIVPLLVIFLFGIIQFGFIFFLQNDMLNAAREAARQMSVQEATEAEAETTADNYLDSWPVNFTINAEDTTTTGDDFVRVTITAPMDEAAMLGDIIGIFTGRTLNAQVEMREEG